MKELLETERRVRKVVRDHYEGEPIADMLEDMARNFERMYGYDTPQKKAIFGRLKEVAKKEWRKVNR